MHAIRAVVGQSSVVAAVRVAAPSARAIPLPQDFELALLDEPAVSALGGDTGDVLAGFDRLTAALVEHACGLSKHGPLVYLETEYFGGHGRQAAALFRAGAVALAESMDDDATHARGPATEWPINLALRELGVTKGPAVDEFDALGLRDHRHVER